MKLSVKEMILISLFSALTAIGAFLNIPLGDVPITLQSMFALLSGLLLGPKLGAASQLVYIVLGLSGMRIFAGFSGCPQAILKPSFGFLIGFVFAAFIVGKITYQQKIIRFTTILFASFVGTLIIYLFGIPYMFIILNNIMNKTISFSMTLRLGCLIFLPGDILKAIISSFMASKLINKINITRT